MICNVYIVIHTDIGMNAPPIHPTHDLTFHQNAYLKMMFRR